MSLLSAITTDTGPDPKSSIIWLHGLGASGHDFASMPEELDLQGCGPIRFIFPHAPVMPVTLNNGMPMRAWYDIAQLSPHAREDEKGLRTSQKLVEELIEAEKARGVPASRIVLAGFSQGCAMTLQTGLRHGETLAGLMCLSGYVPINATLAGERHAANQNTPIFMAHGLYDPIIQFPRATQSRDLLTGLGYHVEWQQYPMEHSVSQEEVRHIGTWLRKVLANPAQPANQ